MEIGSFYVGNYDSGKYRNIKVYNDLTGKLFYKFKDMNHKDCNEYHVIYSLMELQNLSLIVNKSSSYKYPYTINNNGQEVSIKYLMDNTSYTYTFELKSFDLQQKLHICILSQEYKNQDVKDAWVYGLKRNLTEIDHFKYKFFRTVEEFDDFIKNEFNTYKNFKLPAKTINDEASSFTPSNGTEKETQTVQNTSTNTYDTVKLCVDEVNDYVKNMLNKTINGKKQLTPYNLLEEVVSYYTDTDYEGHIKTINKELDIVDVVKEMLISKDYMLSDDFKKNKLDLKDIQFKFKMLTSPETISKDEILAEVFNIDNTVSLI